MVQKNTDNLVFHSFFNFYDHRFSHISSFIHIHIWINIVFACVNIYISTSDLFPHSLTSFLSPHDSVMLMFSGLAKCLFNRIMYTYLITYYRFFIYHFSERAKKPWSVFCLYVILNLLITAIGYKITLQIIASNKIL